jgi:beta-1,4-mannosyl-glycoprotein beta-1,4-N-acetylglucosaminyltransferase
MPKIFDTCIFFNEDMLLALKLKELSKKVDVIVVAEGTESFTGNPHKPQAQKVINEIYTKAEVRHVVVDYPVGITHTWDRESYLRNSISRGLVDFDDGDVCILGDCDEQVDPRKLDEIISRVQSNHVATLRLHWLQQRANLSMCADGKLYDFWLAKAFDRRFYNEMGESLQTIRNFTTLEYVADAGWHYSSMGGPEYMRTKLKNFSHTEYSGEEYASLEVLEKQYSERRDFIQRSGVELRDYDIDNLPSNIWSIEGCPDYLGLR